MTPNQYLKHLFFIIVLFLITAVLKTLSLFINPPAEIPITYWLLPWLGWLLGGVMGFFTLELDRLVDIFITRPETALAREVKNRFAQQKWYEVWRLLLANRHHQLRLVFHSVLFQAAWIFLALFTLTSTPSLFGKGFIMGLGLHLLLVIWHDWRLDPIFLKSWLFWQINRDFTATEIKIYLGVVSFLTLAFLWFI